MSKRVTGSWRYILVLLIITEGTAVEINWIGHKQHGH